MEDLPNVSELLYVCWSHDQPMPGSFPTPPTLQGKSPGNEIEHLYQDACCVVSGFFYHYFSIHLLFYRGKAILIRQKEDDAVAGLFSQIGELYVVHHIWGEF